MLTNSIESEQTLLGFFIGLVAMTPASILTPILMFFITHFTIKEILIKYYFYSEYIILFCYIIIIICCCLLIREALINKRHKKRGN